MDQFSTRLRVAELLAPASIALRRATALAYDLKAGEVGDKLLELELEVLKLRRQMVQLGPLPPPAPQGEHLPF